MTNSVQQFTHEDYEIVKRVVLFQGVYRMVRYELRHRKYNQQWSNTFSREILERPPAACVLPYDPDTDQVIIIEQFRPGALANPQSPWVLEVVAGVYDHTETPPEVAKREAQEEAGVIISDLYPITHYFVSPGATNEYVHLFCGKVDAKTGGGDFGLDNEDEDIRSLVLPTEEAYAWVQEGKIQTAPAIMSIQWLMLNRLWLRQLWQRKKQTS